MNRSTLLSLLAAVAAGTSATLASSHREAPLITTTPKLDSTDFYMFNSYEPGREGYVTIVANYIPLEDAYGGPNYFTLDPEAVYEIHVDNTGDAIEDLTFQFKFNNTLRNIALPIGPDGNRRTNSVPVLAVGRISAGNNGALNLDQTYSLNLITGPRRTGASTAIAGTNGVTTFTKPMDNVGTNTFPNYAAYANQYIYTINLPGTTKTGRVFVGQRKDPFVVNLGETFDLINITTSPVGPENANKDTLWDKNVTSLILEIPKEALTLASDKPVIGAWTTASKVTKNGDTTNYTQLSRLSMPLVNEVVIGLADKDKFNTSEPKDDGQFADYITHPTLPAIIELLYGPNGLNAAAGVKAPTLFPRSDLVNVFALGLAGLNQVSANPSLGEMTRLNTSTPAVAPADQKNMGVIAGDVSGFPNGRRPGDDVVDIALRVVMGKLLTAEQAPTGQLPYTDGATVNALMFLPVFPYLNTPLGGSPNDPEVKVTLQSAPQAGAQFHNVIATFDESTHSLKTAVEGETAIYQTKSANNIKVGAVKVENNTVSIGVTQ